MFLSYAKPPTYLLYPIFNIVCTCSSAKCGSLLLNM